MSGPPDSSKCGADVPLSGLAERLPGPMEHGIYRNTPYSDISESSHMPEALAVLAVPAGLSAFLPFQTSSLPISLQPPRGGGFPPFLPFHRLGQPAAASHPGGPFRLSFRSGLPVSLAATQGWRHSAFPSVPAFRSAWQPPKRAGISPFLPFHRSGQVFRQLSERFSTRFLRGFLRLPAFPQFCCSDQPSLDWAVCPSRLRTPLSKHKDGRQLTQQTSTATLWHQEPANVSLVSYWLVFYAAWQGNAAGSFGQHRSSAAGSISYQRERQCYSTALLLPSVSFTSCY